MDTTILTRLQNWYLSNCDGDWEHNYGISINNLDNPGWIIKIDLSETCLENLNYSKQINNGTFDWLVIKVIDRVLEASGDMTKLETILSIFLDEIIPIYADPEFQYEVYIQLQGGPIKIWRPVKARMISEDILQIINIPDLNYSDLVTLNLGDITFDKNGIFNYKTKIKSGDNVKIKLIETFKGITLIAKE